MRSNELRMLELVERIYDQAWDDCALSPLLESMRKAVHSDCLFYLFHDATSHSGSIALVSGADASILPAYAAASSENPRIRSATAHMRLGDVASGTDYVLDREVKRTRLYSDVLRPLRILPDVGTVVEQDASRFGLLIGARSARRGRYAVHERRRLQLLGSHFSRARQLSGCLPKRLTADVGMRRLLDSLQGAALIVSGRGRIVWTNSAAGRWFDVGVLRETVGRGLQIAAWPEAQVFLQRAVASLGRMDGVRGEPLVKTSVLQDPTSGASYRMTLIPFAAPSHADEAMGSRVVVLFEAMPRQGPTESALRAATAWGLTPTQSQLLQLLVAGRSLAECAEQMQQRVSTTRVVLKQLFGKSGTHRQAALVAAAVRGGRIG